MVAQENGELHNCKVLPKKREFLGLYKILSSKTHSFQGRSKYLKLLMELPPKKKRNTRNKKLLIIVTMTFVLGEEAGKEVRKRCQVFDKNFYKALLNVV